jgi:LAO/AO transport system kinase
MEVADIFVINKYDRPGAENFYNSLKQMLGPAFTKTSKKIPVIKTIATTQDGIVELYQNIREWNFEDDAEQKIELLMEKIRTLIQNERMKQIDKEKMRRDIVEALSRPGFNMYEFAKGYGLK